MTIVSANFFKVVVLKVEVLETTIVDERHFGTLTQANTFADQCRQQGYISITITM